MFSNGANDAANWRNPILGLDNKDGGYGIATGLNYWNLDFSVKKNIRIAESVSAELQGVFTNVLNHDQWLDNYVGLYNDAGFGLWVGRRTRLVREPSNWACASASKRARLDWSEFGEGVPRRAQG